EPGQLLAPTIIHVSKVSRPIEHASDFAGRQTLQAQQVLGGPAVLCRNCSHGGCATDVSRPGRRHHSTFVLFLLYEAEQLSSEGYHLHSHSYQKTRSYLRFAGGARRFGLLDRSPPADGIYQICKTIMAKKQFVYRYPMPAVTADMVAISREHPYRVLLVKRKHAAFQGTWAIPGGFIEIDEDLESAARREFQEETGLSAGR